MTRKSDYTKTFKITPREREVWGLVAEALSDKEIAVRLGITPNTVKTHLKHVFCKMGFHNRVTAALQYKALKYAA